ncbi:MAG: prephenate dehydratase [Pirellulales bacterium]|nr:prephenate dehydratase [Pirellulales bacterium]
MGKGKTSVKPARTVPRSPDLTRLRNEIDRIDCKLIELMNERAELALQVGKIKEQQGQPIYAPNREEEVLNRVVAMNQGPLTECCIRAVFRELISGARALESHLKVAFLGPNYSYSHLAALDRFGQSAELIPVASIAAVFEEVNRGHAHYGLVPLENSTDGRIADTLEMFSRAPVRICGEVQLRVHHHLLGRCARTEIQEVYSKPQALSQCRNWLARHLPQARTVEVTSTTTAAQLAQEKPYAAAIASRQAASHYGLEIISENIEDHATNMTRFAVIGDHPSERSGRDKVAVLFEIEHRPGALADAMSIFKRNRLNMTWIESFPIPDQRGAYMFFVEFDGFVRDAKVKRALASLQQRTRRFEFLGCFPAAEPVG